MDFGKLPYASIDQIDFTLPPDPSTNQLVLTGERHGKVYLGLPQWGRDEWKGTLYPAKTKVSGFLDQYISQFNCVEVNATHYKYYGPARIKAWAHKADGTDFKFLPKLHQDITHKGPLASRDLYLAKCIDELQYFDEQLGPIWGQVIDKYDFRKKHDLFAFFDLFETAVDFFMEVRHPSWFEQPDLFDALRQRHLGAVITDTSAFRYTTHMHLTVPKTMIRFVSNNHPTDHRRIDDWAVRINDWLNKGIEEVYFIIHMNDPLKVIELASYAIQQFNKIASANLKPLELVR